MARNTRHSPPPASGLVTPPLPAANPPRHAWFKAGLFALLAVNTAAYVARGTASEALDALAWLALLVLYELETDFGWGARGGFAARAVRGLRLIAALAVVAAAAGYIREREWLDAINAGLWITIVVMFEWQVRFPATAGRRRWAVKTSAAALYAGLTAVVAIWLWRGEWMDAYDALLWLAALVVIELNILRSLGRFGRLIG
jgi:hypothetical protein